MHHLNDALTNRASIKVGSSIMDAAKLTQPPEGVDLGEGFSSTLAIEMTNVNRTKRNGGGIGINQYSSTVSSELGFTIYAPGGARAMREASAVLQRAAAMMEENENQSTTSPLKLSDNVTLIANQQQFDAHKSRQVRKKAKTATAEDTLRELGNTVYSQTDRSF